MGYPVQFPARTPHRELEYAAIRFSAAATPALLQDTAKLLDPAAPITDLGAGQYRLNFRKDAPYPRVYPLQPCLVAPAAATDRAYIHAVSEGTNPVTIEVRTEISGANADPATAKDVNVGLLLSKV